MLNFLRKNVGLKSVMASKLKSYIGIFISGVLLFGVIRQIDLPSVTQIFWKANIYWIFAALIFYWIEILLRIHRWKQILTCLDSAICYSSVSSSFCAGAAANNIFPFRLGDILRAHILGTQRNISRYSIMGTIVFEKLIDVIAVLLLTCWGAFEVLSGMGVFSKASFTFSMAGAIVVVFGGIYLVAKNKFLSGKFILFFHERLGNFKKGFHTFLNPKKLSLVFLETMLIWTFNSLAIWAIVLSLGVSLSISEVLLLEGIAGLAAAIPSAPAGIGTLQYAFLITFGIMHLDKDVGVAASLLVQSALLGSITLVGMLIFIFNLKTRRVLRDGLHKLASRR